jgi:hypothetical protein
MTHQQHKAGRDTPYDDAERASLESLVRPEYERCHPDETWEDLKRRAAFTREDKGLLRDWMALAAQRARARRDMERHVDFTIAA